jgi:hypothetical protein
VAEKYLNENSEAKLRITLCRLKTSSHDLKNRNWSIHKYNLDKIEFVQIVICEVEDEYH